MSLRHMVARFWRRLVRFRRDDAILREEIDGHLSALEAEYVAAGLSQSDARDAARRRFGNATTIREDVHEELSFGPVERFAQDVRYAARSLSVNVAFSTFTVLTLALGIGVTTAAFSLVNGVLLKQLPFADPDRLVILEERFMPRFPRFEATASDFAAWQQDAKAFSALAAFRNFSASLTGDQPERVIGKRITANLTSLLGVEPMLGRAFRADEDVNGGANVALMGYALWQRRFGGQASVVGSVVPVNGVPYTIVGIMPPSFQFPQRAELWVPMRFTPQQLDPGNGDHNLWAVGRLKPGITLAQALAELNLILPRVHGTKYPWSANGQAADDYFVGEVRSTLLVLMGAASLVLLIAFANVAGLMTARASARTTEMALRVALGATRGRLVQQVLTESFLLATVGAVVGVLLGAGGIASVKALPFMAVPRLEDVTLDYRVLLFALGATFATGLAFGVVPALRVSRETALYAGGRIIGRGSRTTLRNLLIVSEVAFALVLLTGAGLLMKSLSKLLDVELGLEPRNVLTASIALPSVSYREKHQQTQFVDELLRRVAARPEVRSVAVTTGLPLSHVSDIGTGFSESPNGMAANQYRVTPDYWRVMGISLRRGRLLNAGDTPDSPPVIVINETMARRAFPDGEAIGKHAMLGGGSYMREIVGIVADVRQESVRRPPAPQVYEAFQREPSNIFDIVVRTSTEPMIVAEIVRREVIAIDKNLPLASIAPMETLVSGNVARDRFGATLMGLFAFLALLLAAVGIYGVITYAVTQRTREIGIRAALGAGSGRIVSLVVGQSARMVVLGVFIGGAASWMSSRVLSEVLYNVAPRDPTIFVGVASVLLLVALLAAFFPTRRAVRVSPIVALRVE